MLLEKLKASDHGPKKQKQQRFYNKHQADGNKILATELLRLLSCSMPAHNRWLQKIPHHWGNCNFDHSSYILGKGKFYVPSPGMNVHICSCGMHPAPWFHALLACVLDIY